MWGMMEKRMQKGEDTMLFRRKIERACAYCAHAVAIDEDTMVCRKRGPVPMDGACRRFSYDPLKRVPETASPNLPRSGEDADYSL